MAILNFDLSISLNSYSKVNMKDHIKNIIHACRDREKRQFTSQANTQHKVYSGPALGPMSTLKTHKRATKFYLD